MMLELNNYYIQELENLTDLFTNIFVITSPESFIML